MEVTIDHIAYTLMDWCSTEAPLVEQFKQNDECLREKSLHSILHFFNEKGSVAKVLSDQTLFCNQEKVDLVFNLDTETEVRKIFAQLHFESKNSNQDFKKQIEFAYKKLSENRGKDEFVNSDKFLISLYFDLANREFLREFDFIEIFNNQNIACAIKRIK